jgi:UDPglucose 6-dehydrogenase
MALHRTAMENDYDFKILDAVTDVNNFQKRRILNKVDEYFDGKIEGRKVALWGLAFKAETDDIREAPALEIISGLLREGAVVTAYDPEATNNVKKYFPNEANLFFAENQYEALKGAEILIVATEWNTFKNPDFAKMKQLMSGITVFDGRNLYDLGTMKENGFEYFSVGRRAVRP